METMSLSTIVLGVVIGGLVLYMLIKSGLAALIMVFTVTAALTAAVEALVLIGLQLLLPALSNTPLFERLGFWALVLPVVVGLIAAYNLWREMR